MSLRPIQPVLFLAALALLQLSCGREVTGPASGAVGRVAHFALDPQMPSVAALFASVQGISTVVPFDRVRITAQRPDQTLAYDRTVPFPSTADSITLGLAIPLQSASSSGSEAEEGFGVALRIAYINAQGDTVFRGGPVTAFVSATSSTQRVSLPIRYTGIGSGATSVVLTPDSVTVVAGTSSSFVGAALDTSGVLAGTPLFYYSPDTARALIANPAVGTVQWKPSRGVARIIALHPSGLLADTSTVTVSLPASRLALLSGGGQTALGSTALPAPIVIRTVAADEVPVAGVVVDFTITTGSGSLTIVKDTSDANGVVSTNWTLGTLIGTQSITATAAGITPSLTVLAAASSGPTGVAINITSPIGASRYYAVVTGPGIATEVIQKLNASFARSATLTVPLAAGNGYTVYVLAADSLTPLPDTLPVISAGTKFTNVNIPAGNTVPLNATLGSVGITGIVPSSITAGDAFVADITLTDNSRLFYDVFSFVNLYRSDTIVNIDRGGSAASVGGVLILSTTQKRFTANVFRPSATGTIYSQFGGGVATSDRSVVFYVVGPSRQRNENLLTTSVLPAVTGISVSVTAPAAVTRFVVAVDTGAGPIAWGEATSASFTTATISVPVPPGTNYRVRVAGLQDFGPNAATSALLAGLRSGGVLTAQSVLTGFSAVNLTLVAATSAPGVATVGSVGIPLTYSGTMRDPSLFNTTAACLMRYSTTGPISAINAGTLLTTGCTISDRLADGTYSVAGSFPAITAPATLHTQVFTSVIGYTSTGTRVEMVHQGLTTTSIVP